MSVEVDGEVKVGVVLNSITLSVEEARKYAATKVEALAKLTFHPKLGALERALDGQVATVYPDVDYQGKVSLSIIVTPDSEVPRRLAMEGFPLVKEVVPSTGLVLRHQAEGSIKITVFGYITQGCRLVPKKKMVEVTEYGMECGGEDEVVA